MNQSNIVILGGGMVAGYAAKQLRELGLPKGELAILSADTAPPYERPPLSKSFLAGKDTEDAIKINPEDYYKKQGIDLRLECEVASVNIKRRRLILKDGDEFEFHKLVIHRSSPSNSEYSWFRPSESVLPANPVRFQTHPRRCRKGEACGRDWRRFHRNGSGGRVSA
jgi:Pyridine nucleotide-disulphide oxidoreductase